MAQRTIASFFGASPASAPLADATNSNQLGKVASVPFGAPEKRPAPDHDARAAPPSKRVAAPRPFTKGADVVPVPDTTGARPDLVQLCNVDGREYLLNEAVWSCDNLTKPVARWREGPAAKFHVIAGTRGLVAVFSGALLRVYRVPNVDAPPLASACLRCAAAGAGAESPRGCECAGAAPGDFGDADAVHRVASFPAPSTRGEGATETKTKDGIVTPNLAVLTKGGRLRLLLVSDSNSDNDPRANVAAAFASLGLGASSLIEGAFAYAFPDVPRGERFARPFVFWRDPEATRRRTDDRSSSPDRRRRGPCASRRATSPPAFASIASSRPISTPPCTTRRCGSALPAARRWSPSAATETSRCLISERARRLRIRRLRRRRSPIAPRTSWRCANARDSPSSDRGTRTS